MNAHRKMSGRMLDAHLPWLSHQQAGDSSSSVDEQPTVGHSHIENDA